MAKKIGCPIGSKTVVIVESYKGLPHKVHIICADTKRQQHIADEKYKQIKKFRAEDTPEVQIDKFTGYIQVY